MYCPFCSHEETKVLESRIVEEAMRRRRECLECGNRFTTYERAVFHLTVLKKDGREEPFQLEKIQKSVARALGKAEEQTADDLAKKAEQRLLLKKMNPLKTTLIGKIVLQELRKVDKIAYLRFATVHKAIEDPKLLKKEIQLIA